MNLVQLRIKRTIVSSRYGAMSAGDMLRTDAAYARHLVEDLAAAKYMTAQPAPSQPAALRKRRGKPSPQAVPMPSSKAPPASPRAAPHSKT